jgi:hypothetical protein
MKPLLPSPAVLSTHLPIAVPPDRVRIVSTPGTCGGLGGKICVPAHDIAGVGRFYGITSPQGVMFYLIKYTR